MLTFRLSAMMFLQFASLGVWNVTLGSYITSNTGQKGRALFDSDFVGDLLITQALGAMIAPVLMGVVADRRVSTEQLLALLHAVSAACLWAMASADRQWVFYAATLGYFQVFAPTGALMSSLALRHLPDGQRAFPFVRAMGTLGWIAAGVLVGVGWRSVTGESIEATAVPMRLGMACHLLTAAYCLTLPHTPPLAKINGNQPSGWRALTGGRELWGDRSFVVLIVLSALVLAPAQFYNGFVHPFLDQRGFADAASKLSLGQVGEVLIMIALPWFSLRFGLKALFLCGAVAWAARFALFAACGDGPSVWLAYPAILVHGVAFVFVYLTGQLYIDRHASPTARAAAQGVHSMAVFGVGSLLGAAAVGVSQARFLTPSGVDPPPYDWPPFWMAACLISAVGAVLFALLFREDGQASDVTTTASGPASGS